MANTSTDSARHRAWGLTAGRVGRWAIQVFALKCMPVTTGPTLINLPCLDSICRELGYLAVGGQEIHAEIPASWSTLGSFLHLQTALFDASPNVLEVACSWPDVRSL